MQIKNYKISKQNVLDRVIDLKNAFLFGEWYRDVLNIANKEFKETKNKFNIEFEVRSAKTDLFIFGFLCFPPNWTTKSKKWLKDQIKNFNHSSEPFYEMLIRDPSVLKAKEIEIYNRCMNSIKHYFSLFIEAKYDTDWIQHKKFKTTRISNKDTKKYLINYLELLKSYETDKIPLFGICKEISLILLSLIN